MAQTLARYGNARRDTPISAVPHRERYEHLQPQSDYDRGTVLVPRHATSPRSGSRGLAPQGTAEAAAGAEPWGGQACPDHGDEPEGASDANAGLWLRVAGQRGGAAASGRHRQRAEDHPHRAVEGTERPARDAASGGPEAVAAMVEGAADRVRHQRRARTKLAVSRSQSTSASDHASVQPAVQGSRESRGAAQDALFAFASSQLRDSSARAPQGHSRHSGVARTREVGDDGPLHPRGDRNDCQDRKPPGGPERAAPQAYEAGQ